MNRRKPLCPDHTDASGQPRPGGTLICEPGPGRLRQLTVQAALPDVTHLSAVWLARVIEANCSVCLRLRSAGAENHDA